MLEARSKNFFEKNPEKGLTIPAIGGRLYGLAAEGRRAAISERRKRNSTYSKRLSCGRESRKVYFNERDRDKRRV